MLRAVSLHGGQSTNNEAALIAKLRSNGIKVVAAGQAESYAFFDQIYDANLTISEEGSQCSDAIYALRNEGVGLLVLQPHDRFWLPHQEWVNRMGYKFGCVVADPSRGSFWIEPSEVLRTIDLLIRRLAELRTRLPAAENRQS